jgi:hypothetical protein
MANKATTITNLLRSNTINNTANSTASNTVNNTHNRTIHSTLSSPRMDNKATEISNISRSQAMDTNVADIKVEAAQEDRFKKEHDLVPKFIVL